MAKYLVETYYNCSFKVSHYLDDIDENELSNLEKREDGKFEILEDDGISICSLFSSNHAGHKLLT